MGFSRWHSTFFWGLPYLLSLHGAFFFSFLGVHRASHRSSGRAKVRVPTVRQAVPVEAEPDPTHPGGPLRQGASARVPPLRHHLQAHNPPQQAHPLLPQRPDECLRGERHNDGGRQHHLLAVSLREPSVAGDHDHVADHHPILRNAYKTSP